ncbi:hypothetical protein SEA_POTATOSPLIT_66 [Mycobacterium phage PotatoSplit]|uniref:Uncharacterized protein n=29 Tax=Microwolfvirus TaxID=2942894 RepID=A0A345L1H4_9CAUD|nr:hypothetical protein M611_gp32 [Mycobacterium phage Jobu08]YP_009195162.1 hypothetical protein AVT20_gp35 [Mycobacterium phage Tiffany]YP_009198490.1 hypothetical protein AVV34_gp35 [Mycobacterium phage MarQuardt]YP_009219127.1 hypothetical protein AVV42_gp37 [Mycobacterium phage Anubis]YP_009635653.1 hypothetical protein FGG58_gp32 [Mycobacterium phage JHC117]YP_010060106.1 membrane protein [Mycobacterium phage SoilDragon]YP_010060195.1 hypothetical protein KIJ59_gp26 [Mycobacterium phage
MTLPQLFTVMIITWGLGAWAYLCLTWSDDEHDEA